MNIYLDLNSRQKQNGGYELKKVFAEKYYAKITDKNKKADMSSKRLSPIN